MRRQVQGLNSNVTSDAPSPRPQRRSFGAGKMNEQAASREPRFGFVAVIGAPNVGKSTLVNALVGAKVTIVSHKVQTTRTPIRGIAIEGESQLVLVDTPGIFAPRRRLDKAMINAAWAGTSEADLVVLVVDAKHPSSADVDRILERLKAGRADRQLLALNKIDKVKKERLLQLAADVNARAPFSATFMISALTGSGIGDLKAHLAAAVPAGPWQYPADDLTDVPLRVLAAEITREKIYLRLHDELPYSTTVETTAWSERKDNSVRIEQTIYVERPGHKGIVVGKGGRTIKEISMDARAELSAILEQPVHLILFVKVREGWEHDPVRYREMGLEFPKD
jgi:GTPase